MGMWIIHGMSRLAHLSATRSLSSIENIPWVWPFLVTTILLFVVLLTLFVWYAYRLALVKIDADLQLIRWVYAMRFLAFEVMGFPTFLGGSIDVGSLSGSDYALLALFDPVILWAVGLGMIVIIVSIWLEWRAQRQGRWRLRR